MSSVVTVSIWSPEKANEKIKSVNPCIELACCFCKDLSANRTDANVDCGRQQKHSSVLHVTVILMQTLVQVPSVTLVLWCFFCQTPLGAIDLGQCVSNTVTTVSRDLCARPNTMELKMRRNDTEIK